MTVEPPLADTLSADLRVLREETFWLPAGPNGPQKRALAALDRIAVLVPQHPAQARTTIGDLIWQHIPCGWAHPWHPDATPDVGPDGDPVGCHEPGPWRPLLGGGGDPAPERPAVVEAWKAALAERDEARAEADRLSAALAAALTDLEALKAAQPDPHTLTLPQVPEGAVALVDRHQRRWTETEKRTTSGQSIWRSESDAVRTYGALLIGSGPLTVEMAPPREPRTWKADAAPEGLTRATDINGIDWFLSTGSIDSWVCPTRGDAGPWAYVLAKYGPLTEVLDGEDAS